MDFDFSSNPDEAYKAALVKVRKFLASHDDPDDHGAWLRISVTFNRNKPEQVAAIINASQKESLRLVNSELLEVLAARGVRINPFHEGWFAAQLDAMFSSDNEVRCSQLSKSVGYEGTIVGHFTYRSAPLWKNKGLGLIESRIIRSFVSEKYLGNDRRFDNERMSLGTSAEHLVHPTDLEIG